MQPVASSDITRTLLSVVVIGALLIGSIWTLLPFLSALIWAATIVIATWPLLLWVQRLTGGRRSLAAATMTFLVLLAVIASGGLGAWAVMVPLFVIVSSFAFALPTRHGIGGRAL